MRDETSEWLSQMLEAVDERIDLMPLMTQATMPAAEAGTPWADWLAQQYPPDARGPSASAIDWVQFGQLLRHELGWDDSYPAYPAYPEIRGEL